MSESEIVNTVVRLTNVAPAVPVPQLWVFLPVVEVLVLLWQHDIAEPEGDDLGFWIPSRVLLGNGLAHQLGERVGGFRLPLVLLGDGERRRLVRVEWNTDQRL